MQFLIQRETSSTVSPHPMDQEVSPCYHSFLTITQSYHSKVTPMGALHTEKIAEEVVLLFVFRIRFPASLITHFYFDNTFLIFKQTIFDKK